MAQQAKYRRRAHWGLWSAYPGVVRQQGSKLGRWAPALIALFLAFLTWLIASRSGLVPEILLPDPMAVLQRVGTWATTGLIWPYFWATMKVSLLGGLLAIVIAIPLGVVLAHSRLLAAALEPFVAFSQAIPLVAIAPLLVLWLGYGAGPIAILCAVIAFFPMVTTCVVGLRSVDIRIIENAWLDGATGWQRLAHIELPVAAPAILAGVRAGMVLSMTGAIVGEFVMGGSGLATLLTISRESADTVGVFAVLGYIAAAALVLQGTVQIFERASAARLQGE